MTRDRRDKLLDIGSGIAVSGIIVLSVFGLLWIHIGRHLVEETYQPARPQPAEKFTLRAGMIGMRNGREAQR